jgi:hypothetical protein
VVDFHILGPLSKFWEKITPHFQEEGRRKKKGKKTSMVTKAKYINSIAIVWLW